jgi:hypothetical protein
VACARINHVVHCLDAAEHGTGTDENAGPKLVDGLDLKLSIELASSSDIHMFTINSEGEGMNESIQMRPAPSIYAQ